MLATAQRFMSVREVAAYLGVHQQTVYALIRNGELGAFQPRGKGHTLSIDQEALERWLTGRHGPGR
jgi:excisionase family DNA binding protein